MRAIGLGLLQRFNQLAEAVAVSVRPVEAPRRARPLLLERLEERVLLAATPAASVNAPATDFINESVSFTVSFDNTGAAGETGYAPHLDIVIPVGITGESANYLGAAITLTPVAYWDATDGRWETLADGNGTAYSGHPQDSTGAGGFIQPYGNGTTPPVNAATGDVWYSVELPFGSFVATQPQADITISGVLNASAGAVVGVPLTIQATGSFAYGVDALNNPGSDPPVQGSAVSATITPTVWTISKSHDGPEGETATGPNFPRTWTITVDIANLETVSNITIRDALPSNLVYLGNLTVTAGGSIVDQPTVNATVNPADNLIQVNYANRTGTTGTDITISYQAYVNEFNFNSSNVLSPTTGDDGSSVNSANATGTYANATLPTITANSTLADKSIAIQKSVAVVGGGGVAPGATLEYTLSFQISDYFEFEDLGLDDIFGDGQLFDASFTPRLTLHENGNTLTSVNFSGANYNVQKDADGNITTGFTANLWDGSTQNLTIGQSHVQFALSNELISRNFGANGAAAGILSGDLHGADNTLTAGTTGTIVYRTVIQQDYTDRYLDPGSSGSGDSSVDAGDNLDNSVVITGSVRNNGSATGFIESDTSGAGVTIERPTATKSIYAINGNTGYTLIELAPGETVTYRITITNLYGDIENLVLEDYLPLPVLNASEVTSGIFNTTSAVPPAAGFASYGPNHTLTDVVGAPQLVDESNANVSGDPVISADAANNVLSFSFGTFDVNGTGGPYTIDILFTVTAQDQPFGDGLFLTNQAQVSHGTTFQSTQAVTEIVQIELVEPDLEISKGVVSTNAVVANFSQAVGPTGITWTAPNNGSAPFTGGAITSAGLGANPVDANLSGVDAHDLVKFAVVVENKGQRDGYDLLLNDTLPAGFVIPTGGLGLNLQVYAGDGSSTFNVTTAGGTDITGNAAAIASAFFGSGGLRITDPGGGNGAINAGSIGGVATTDGSNILVITYDLQADANINPATNHTNTARLLAFAAIEGGTDFTLPNGSNAEDNLASGGQWVNEANVTAISPAAPVKTIIATGVNGSNNNLATQAVIGETVQYSITLNIAEGQIQLANVTDNLDLGLIFLSLDSITASANVSSSVGSFGNLAAFAPTVTGNGTTVAETLTFNFGTLTNTNTSNAVTETITLNYTAQVANILGDQAGTALNNTATFGWDPDGAGGNYAAQVTAAGGAPNLTVIEPELNVSQTITIDGSGTTGDAGDTVVFSIVLNHANASSPEAFDVLFNNTISPFITITGVNASHSVDGDISAMFTFNATAGTVNTTGAANIDVAVGETVTINVTGTLNTNVTPNLSISNTPTIQWSSMDGNGSGSNPAIGAAGGSNGERNGQDGLPTNGSSPLNNYRDDDTDSLTISLPTATKSVIATSEAHTGVLANGTTVAAIGEIVRYRLVVQLIEGTMTNFQMEDALPSGLQFLNDGTAMVAFVSDGAGGANGTGITANDTSASGGEDWGISNVTAFFNGTSNATTPVFALDDDSISTSRTVDGDTYGDGTDIFFKLGDVVNRDTDDGDAEYAIIEFNALAHNLNTNATVRNDAGDLRVNSFGLELNGNATNVVTSGNANVLIAEPVITNVVKTLTVTPQDAGDTVTYSITFSNTATGNTARQLSTCASRTRSMPTLT